MNIDYFAIFTSHIILDHETDNGHRVVLLEKTPEGFLCWNRVTGKEIVYEWFQLNPQTFPIEPREEEEE